MHNVTLTRRSHASDLDVLAIDINRIEAQIITHRHENAICDALGTVKLATEEQSAQIVTLQCAMQ